MGDLRAGTDGSTVSQPTGKRIARHSAEQVTDQPYVGRRVAQKPGRRRAEPSAVPTMPPSFFTEAPTVGRRALRADVVPFAPGPGAVTPEPQVQPAPEPRVESTPVVAAPVALEPVATQPVTLEPVLATPPPQPLVIEPVLATPPPQPLVIEPVLATPPPQPLVIEPVLATPALVVEPVVVEPRASPAPWPPARHPVAAWPDAAPRSRSPVPHS